MKREEFTEWLSNKKYGKNTIPTRVGNVARIDDAYDIDTYYASDLTEELKEQFVYTRQDQRNGLEPKACITIDGDYYDGMATLRSALTLYIKFLDDTGIVKKKATPVADTPVFKGSLKQFTAYIGPHYRNLVQSISKKERDSHGGICEYCHKKAELQSAHLTGEERPEIIRKILEKDFRIGTDLFEIPLAELDVKFKDAHMPLRKHFYFLCKDCHKAYDKSKTLTDAMILAERRKA